MNDLIPDKYREDEELIRLTIEQLRKDFGSHFPELHFSGQKDQLFRELTVQVAETLKEIKRTNPVFLKVILYQVDVPESESNRLKDQKDCFSLAEIIIQREFKKVITRRFFAG